MVIWASFIGVWSANIGIILIEAWNLKPTKLRSCMDLMDLWLNWENSLQGSKCNRGSTSWVNLGSTRPLLGSGQPSDVNPESVKPLWLNIGDAICDFRFSGFFKAPLFWKIWSRHWLVSCQRFNHQANAETLTIVPWNYLSGWLLWGCKQPCFQHGSSLLGDGCINFRKVQLSQPWDDKLSWPSYHIHSGKQT